ncbi:bacteriocin-like protein [Epilithonimonas sp.]|uniref:bacteriocin-like protein n=1 Tax=Epilithonimonas sp. TaxID=2894511 RepID=UPI00289B31A7|nr:hypothetical protein [Epilithonimonas sp.]
MKNLKKLSRREMKSVAGGLAKKWVCCADNGCSPVQTGDYTNCNKSGGTVVIIK